MKKLALICLLALLASLYPEQGEARRRRRWRRRAKPRVALVPIAGTGRAARKLAYKLTRSLSKRLRRGRKLIRLSGRRGAKLRSCLQEPQCVRQLGRKHRVRFLVAGHVLQAGRTFHVDLAVVSVELGGVANSVSFRTRSKWKVVTGGAATAERLLRGAPRAVAKAKAKAPPKVESKPPAKPPVVATAKPEPDVPKLRDEQPEEPIDPKKLLADQNKPPELPKGSATPAGEKGFFSSILAKRYWAGWTALMGSTGALVAAIVFGVTSRGAISDAQSTELQVDAWTLRDKAEKNALTANIFFGVAGAAAIASGVLFYLEYKTEQRERSRRKLRVDLRVMPQGGAVGLQGHF